MGVVNQRPAAPSQRRRGHHSRPIGIDDIYMRMGNDPRDGRGLKRQLPGEPQSVEKGFPAGREGAASQGVYFLAIRLQRLRERTSGGHGGKHIPPALGESHRGFQQTTLPSAHFAELIEKQDSQDDTT